MCVDSFWSWSLVILAIVVISTWILTGNKLFTNQIEMASKYFRVKYKNRDNQSVCRFSILWGLTTIKAKSNIIFSTLIKKSYISILKGNVIFIWGWAFWEKEKNLKTHLFWTRFFIRFDLSFLNNFYLFFVSFQVKKETLIIFVTYFIKFLPFWFHIFTFHKS